jgi:hypothetical protein
MDACRAMIYYPSDDGKLRCIAEIIRAIDYFAGER